VQGVSVTSDGAELLGDSVDLLVGFSYGVEDDVPKVKLSMRSHTGVDCAAIAKAHGGGGHTAAAGCSMRVDAEDPHPFAFVKRLLSAP
jgi:nanoRNase/pAp phosphatase (c-di-AMP/oligoRNAs hydrolase)